MGAARWLIDQGPYRIPEEPPKPVVKYEWYFKQSDDVFSATAVPLLFISVALTLAAMCNFIFDPRSLLSWTWFRALTMPAAYCAVWFALALRRKPVE